MREGETSVGRKKSEHATGIGVRLGSMGRGAWFGITEAGYHAMFHPEAKYKDPSFMIDGTTDALLIWH